MEPNKMMADGHSETVVKDAIVDPNYKLKEADGATVDAYDYFKSLDLKLTEEDKKRIGEEIISLAEKYETKNKIFYDEWKELRTWYEDELPEKLLPWAGCSQHNEPIIQRDVDTYVSRIKRVVFGRRPYVIFSSLDPAKLEDTRRKENYLDHTMNTKMKIKDGMGPIFHDTTLLGTSACGLDWYKEISRIKDIETYEAKDLQKFLQNYPDAGEKYPEFISKLQSGEKLELVVEYDDVVYNAPKVEHIELEDLIIDCDIKDLNKQVLLGSKVEFTKDELIEQEEEGFFENTKEVIGEAELLDKDYTGKVQSHTEDEPYVIYKVVYKFKKDGDKIRRKGMFWVEKDTGVILKSIAYPYWHNKPNIVLFYIEDHGNKVFRRGIGYRQLGLNDATNTVIRQAIDNNSLANIPIFSTRPDSDFDPAFDGIYPGIKLPYGADIKQLEIRTNVRDCLEIGNYIKRSAEGRTGVTNYMTGGESPSDPNSPMGKTQVLLGESNLRLAAPIECIQRGFVELCALIIELEYQFIEEGEEFKVLGEPSTGKNAFDEITRESLHIRGDFISQGSLDAINPDVEFSKNQFMYMTLSKDPAIASNPVAMHELLRALVISASEYWEKNVDKIAPDPVKALEQIADFTKKIEEKKKEIQQKWQFESLVMKGMDPEQAMIAVQSMAYKAAPPPDREAMGLEPEPEIPPLNMMKGEMNANSPAGPETMGESNPVQE